MKTLLLAALVLCTFGCGNVAHDSRPPPGYTWAATNPYGLAGDRPRIEHHDWHPRETLTRSPRK